MGNDKPGKGGAADGAELSDDELTSVNGGVAGVSTPVPAPGEPCEGCPLYVYDPPLSN